jgi:hypothetical protein
MKAKGNEQSIVKKEKSDPAGYRTICVLNHYTTNASWKKLSVMILVVRLSWPAGRVVNTLDLQF